MDTDCLPFQSFSATCFNKSHGLVLLRKSMKFNVKADASDWSDEEKTSVHTCCESQGVDQSQQCTSFRRRVFKGRGVENGSLRVCIYTLVLDLSVSSSLPSEASILTFNSLEIRRSARQRDSRKQVGEKLWNSEQNHEKAPLCTKKLINTSK